MHCVDSFQAANYLAPYAFSVICPRADLSMQFAFYGTAVAGDVLLEGINFDCAGFSTHSGVEFFGTGTLTLRNVTVRNCTNGIAFTPNGPSKLRLFNVSVEKMSGAGLLIQPTVAATVQVEIDGFKATGSQGGVYVQANAGTNIDVNIRNSVLSQNVNYGLVSNSGGGVSAVFIDSSSIAENANVGVYSSGASSFVLVNKSTIVRNNLGWTFASGGTLATYANNVVSNASSFGGPSVTIGLQ